MVFCPKCGKTNEDNATFCTSCGFDLQSKKTAEKREDDCFGSRRGRDDECFGLPHGGSIAAVIFGALIVVLGLALLFGFDVGRFIGPFIVVTIGILIVLGALYGMSRRRS